MFVKGLLDPSSLREVHVNGKRLERQELAYVDSLNCGELVPNGNYWMNASARSWGYVGEPGVRSFPDCAVEARDSARERRNDQAAAPSDTNANDPSTGSEGAQAEIDAIRREAELSRYQTEITRQENNGGMYVPSR